METKEIENVVTQKLESLFITVQVTYAGEQTKDDNWKCDAWRVTFKRGAQKDFKQFATDYYTGIGHRKSRLKRPHFVNPRSIAAEAWDKQNLKPVAPHVDGVLHSLLMDGDAINTSFEYWCADYGYEVDSIKAFNTYRACCDIGKQINAFFSHSERDELKTLTEEY